MDLLIKYETIQQPILKMSQDSLQVLLFHQHEKLLLGDTHLTLVASEMRMPLEKCFQS